MSSSLKPVPQLSIYSGQHTHNNLWLIEFVYLHTDYHIINMFKHTVEDILIVNDAKCPFKYDINLVEKIINSEYDQEIPQSQTTDNPKAPRRRAAQP